MTTDSLQSTPVPQMHAETGFDESESAAPLRISGFICLLLGLLSVLSLFGQPLLVFPIAAIAVGIFALRRSDGPRPIGTRPAVAGLVLAFGFGSCGLFLPWFKTMTLASQAKQFSRDYLEVLARGEDLVAIELSKDYVNRFPPSMNLKEHYAISEVGQRQLEEFRDSSVNEAVMARGPGAEWELERPIRVWYSYGREHAEVVWQDPTGETSTKVRMFLEYRIDSSGDGQWHVERVIPLAPAHVAPSIL